MSQRRRPRRSRGQSARNNQSDTPVEPRSYQVSFNEGKVLAHLAKTTYTTLTQAIAEAVQNGLDAEATNIWIAVDEAKRTISIGDNGAGVTAERFGEALRSVGHGIKDPGSLGRFGLGLISPLDKCAYFTFSSRVNQAASGLRWTFRMSEIEAQSENVQIPCANIRWGKNDPWSTVVRIHQYTKDTQTAGMTAERIVEFVQAKLGPAMRKRGVTCTVYFKNKHGESTTLEVKPTEFRGEPFKVFIYEEPDAGVVEFELYRAPKTSQGRKGQIMFSELEALYPITWSEFRNQARNWLSEDVRAAFNSGYFEGIIRAKNVELHPDRRKFVWGDAVVGMCIAIEQWYKDVGVDLYTDERVLEREKRYQRLGAQTMERLKELLNLEGFDHLRNVLQALREGTVASGHAEVESGKETERPGLRAGQGGTGKPRTPNPNPTPRPTKDTEKGPERPGDIPNVSYGPDGQHRNIVRDNSTGIGIIHETLPGSDRLWEIDVKSAMIYINVRHPVFLLVEHADTYILQLQEWIIIQALTMLQFPDEARLLIHDFSDAHAREYVQVSVLGAGKRRRSS